MRLLLDTQILLWALAEPARLRGPIRDIIVEPANDVFFSAASIWEIAVKTRLGRADFAFRPEQIFRTACEDGFRELPVSAETAALVADLPLHHRDPFDRLLVAQAVAGPFRLYTADAVLAQYSELVTVVS